MNIFNQVIFRYADREKVLKGPSERGAIVISVLNSATQAIQRSQVDLARQAASVKRWGASPAPAPGGLVSAAVDLSQARQEMEANLAVIRVADDMLGSLLDVLA